MERLIENVRKYQCLWNKECEGYKNNDLKEAAWKEVAKECELNDVKEARACWKKLRDGHRQALSKKKTTTGQAATSKFLWKYEKQMEFLLDSMKNRRRSTNVESEDIIQDEENSNEDEQHQNEESNDSVINQPYGNLVPPNKKATLVSVLEKEQKRREKRSLERDTLRKQILLSSSTATPKPDTALEKFFHSMQLTTQSLPERLQLRIQRQVFNIVMEAREEHLATQPNNSANEVSNLRGDSAFQLPIGNWNSSGPSRAASSLSNYEYSNTSPAHSNIQANQESYIMTSPEQYTSPAHSSPQLSQPSYITSPADSRPQTNQARYSVQPNSTSDTTSTPLPRTSQSVDTATCNIRSYYKGYNFE